MVPDAEHPAGRRVAAGEELGRHPAHHSEISHPATSTTRPSCARRSRSALRALFAHFPRKEDMLFDRYPEVAGQLTRAIAERTAGMSAVSEACRPVRAGCHPLGPAWT